MKKIAYVGIDYHKNSLTIAVLIHGNKKIYETVRLKNEDKLIRKYMKKLSGKYNIKTLIFPPKSGHGVKRPFSIHIHEETFPLNMNESGHGYKTFQCT